MNPKYDPKRVGNTLLIGSFSIVVLSACVFSVMGYYYLNYRNVLMQNATVKSGKMSLWVVAHNLEKEILAQENRVLLDFIASGDGTWALQDLSQLQKHHPIVQDLFLIDPAMVVQMPIENEVGMEAWLRKQLQTHLKAGKPPPLTLRHSSGVVDGGPVQMAYMGLPQVPEEGGELYLLFTIDLDYVRQHLLPEQIATVSLPLYDVVLQESLAPTQSSQNQADMDLRLTAHFSELFPFWSLAAILEASGMNKRAKMEFIIYTAILVLVFFLIILSVYFIWGQMQQDRKESSIKSQMLSHVSHELKTPLALVKMFTETLLLHRVKSPEQVDNYYRIILSECDRLHLLINNTLDYSSIEKGLKIYSFNRGDITEAVHDVIVSYDYYLEQNGFLFEADIDTDIPPFSFDKIAMVQIVANLLDNAMKFSPENKDIRLKLVTIDQSLLLEVSDCGIGMKQDKQETIFKPYHRLSHRFRGSGIGLSLVKHAVEAHGGTICVTSTEGEGSTFSLIFPMAVRGADA